MDAAAAEDTPSLPPRRSDMALHPSHPPALITNLWSYMVWSSSSQDSSTDDFGKSETPASDVNDLCLKDFGVKVQGLGCKKNQEAHLKALCNAS